ncbi:MAG: protein kinase [Planctomycetota bacterium]
MRLAVSRGLLSPTDGQHMESLHQQGQGSAVQLLEARGLAVQELQRSFGGTPFGCRACGFACAANQVAHLPPDLRCPKCGQASLAPGRAPSARLPRSGSSLVRPTTGAFPAGGRAASASHVPPATGSFPPAGRQGTGSYPSARPQTGSFPGASQGYPSANGQTAGYPQGETGVENSGGSHMPRAHTVIRAGSSIGGYLLGRELGRGACGHVFLARRQGLSRDFAVKVLRQDMLGNSEAVARFFREADLASKLNDPGVVSALDVGQDGQHCYYVMDYCAGQTLKQRMRERPYSVAEAVELARELARVQKVAHQRGVVHRDFKPSNIMLADPDGRPKVTDFGLARDTSSKGQTLSRTGDLIGTPIYMAPEQLMGERADVRADVYALGVILYELLCGKRPYEAPTTIELATLVLDGRPTPPRSINPAIDPALEAIVLKALAKERGDRYRDGGEFEAALADYMAGASAPPERARVSRRRSAVAPSRPGRSRLPLLVGGGVLLLALGVGGALLYSAHQAEQHRQRQLAALDRALVQAREEARLGSWDGVPAALSEALALAEVYQREDAVGEVVAELGATYLAQLELGSTSRIPQAETRLKALEAWPGYALAAELGEQVREGRALLEVRQSLQSMSREASRGVDYAQLIDSLKTIEATSPPSALLHVKLAGVELALRRCQLREAEARAQELLGELRLPPEVERGGRLNLAISQLFLERHADAQQTADALSKRWPDSREAQLARCLSLFSQGQIGGAQDGARAVVTAFPDWLPAQLYGAVLVYYGEEGGHARDWLSAVEADQPDNVFLIYAKGLAQGRERAPQGALDQFEQVLRVGNPPLLDAMISTSGILMFANQHEEAGRVLALARQHYPEAGEPLFYLGLQRVFVGVFARMGGMMGAKVELPEGVTPEALAEEGAQQLRKVKQDLPEAYRRSVQRLPGGVRDGIGIVIDAPEGQVITAVTQAVMQGRLSMGGGGGRWRRR